MEAAIRAWGAGLYAAAEGHVDPPEESVLNEFVKTRLEQYAIEAALLERGILTGTSADPHVLRLLPAYILNEGHVDILRDALAKIPA